MEMSLPPSPEGCQLEDFLAVDSFMERCVGEGCRDTQVFVEDLLHALVGLADADGVFAHYDAGDAPLGAIVGERADVVGWYGALVDHFVAHEAIGAVHRDITVYQSSFLQGTQVVDDDARTAGGDENAVAFGLADNASTAEAGISWVRKLTSVPSMSKNRALVIAFNSLSGAQN